MYQLRDTNNGSVQVVSDDYQALTIACAILCQLGVVCEIVIQFE